MQVTATFSVSKSTLALSPSESDVVGPQLHHAANG